MKTAVIHRYPVTPIGLQKVTMPKGAKIQNVQAGSQGWNIYASHLTAAADETVATEVRAFVTLKTGVEFPAGGQYLATIRGGLHLIELVGAAQVAAYETMYPAIDEADADAVLPAAKPGDVGFTGE